MGSLEDHDAWAEAEAKISRETRKRSRLLWATASAEVIGPFVVGSCYVRDLNGNSVGRDPRGYEAQKL